MNFVIRKNDDDFLATCPDVQGAMAEGSTPFEAFYNLIDVIKVIQEYRDKKTATWKEDLEFSLPLYA